MKKLFIKFIKFYQKNISSFSQPKCRFYPTCSQYAIEAIEKFGCLRGLFLSFKRFLKCNPFGKHGVDFVPEKFNLIDKKEKNNGNI